MMAPTTWRDAEIDLHNARIGAMRLAEAALDEVEPWLTEIESLQLRPAHVMLGRRMQQEQEALDAQEAAIRHEAS